MKTDGLKLRQLLSEDEISFRYAVAAFANEVPPFEFAFDFEESVPFIEYIRKLERWSSGDGLPDKFVPNTFFVGVVDDQIVGRLSLRHHLNDFFAKNRRSYRLWCCP